MPRRQKVPNMHGYAIRAVPKDAKVGWAKSDGKTGCKRTRTSAVEKGREKKRECRTARRVAGHPFSFEASDAPKLSKRPQRQYVTRLR